MPDRNAKGVSHAVRGVSGAAGETLKKAGAAARGAAGAGPGVTATDAGQGERPLPVEESIDVAVRLETAYDRFTEFEEYANVLSRGESVDERPHERIAWRRTDGVQATAVITFHRLGDRLTRVMVTYDGRPQ